MIGGLLFIIAGLMFCFTGIGALIGVPFLIIGFLILFACGVRTISPIGALLIIGALILAFGSRSHAAEANATSYSDSQAPGTARLVKQMISMHRCMVKAAGPQGNNAREMIRSGGNPLVMMTDKCPSETVAYVTVCMSAGYDKHNCIEAIVGDAKDIVSAIAIGDEMGP